MALPDVTALPVEEGVQRLREEGYICIIKELHSPQGAFGLKYEQGRIARQSQLPSGRVELLVVYIPKPIKGGEDNGP